VSARVHSCAQPRDVDANLTAMHTRRDILRAGAIGLAAACTHGKPAAGPTDAGAFRAARRTMSTKFGTIEYADRGSGRAALFLHGAPLNSFQWRGAIDRLSSVRRCVAPDFMGLGYSEIADGQSLRADAQAEMLAALLDALAIRDVDIVASDSGGAVAQLFAVKYRARVRTLLLTNCDVEPDSPPAKVKVAIEMARAGTLGAATAEWLVDKPLARSTFGAAVYHTPDVLTDEAIEYYVRPLVGSPRRIAQYHAFHTALEPNPLQGIEAALKRLDVPLRIVWGSADDIFSPADAAYLDRTFSKSRGIRHVPDGKLFFPEEFPDVIADEARALWGYNDRSRI
jgi:pimeloyl-ACP methyl ester carboxylesterase